MASRPWSYATEEDRYGPVLAVQHESPTFKAIWRHVYGADYPEEAEPFGFLTRTELEHLMKRLRMHPGGLLADLGCGRGGPGMWVARETGAHLVGLDVAPQGPAAAQRRAAAFALGGRAGFVASNCSQIGLHTAAFDAAMSVDAIWMVLDKVQAFTEIRRILRPGARLVFTTWQPAYLNYADLLGGAGFDEVTAWSPPDWLERQLAVYARILASVDQLVAELGPDAADIVITEAQETPALLAGNQRLVISAVRT